MKKLWHNKKFQVWPCKWKNWKPVIVQYKMMMLNIKKWRIKYIQKIIKHDGKKMLSNDIYKENRNTTNTYEKSRETSKKYI